MSDTSESAEARIFSRYLVGSEAGAALIERYRAANTRLIRTVSPGDQRLLEMALRRPWVLPCLDSAVAILRPTSALRQKLLLMAAILEATPEHADRFLPRPRGPVGLGMLLAGAVLRSAVQIALGAAIIWASERRP